MAEEENKDVNLQEGAQESEQHQEEPQYTETELRAMEQGWIPKDKYEGEPNDFRSAKDFLERGEMIGKLRSQSQELQVQRAAIEKLAKQNSSIYESGYKRAIADLQAQRKEALEQGDLVKAEEIRDQIDETKEQLEAQRQSAAKPATPQVDPGYNDWIQQNPWYHDKVMQKFADSLALEFMHVNHGQVSPDQIREYVAKTVKEEFAHRFKQADTKVRGAPNPDGNGRGSGKETSAHSNELSKVEKGMTDEERGIMRTVLRATPGMTKEQYLKMYAEVR